MKTLYMFLIFIFLITTAQAQEIEATLSGSTASQAFSVKDDVGNTLFRVGGDGNVGHRHIEPARFAGCSFNDRSFHCTTNDNNAKECFDTCQWYDYL